MRTATVASALCTTPVAIVLAAIVLAAAGCNTDRVWEPRQRVAKPPTTSFTNPDGVEVPDIAIADAREIDLVEEVLMHRAHYHRSLTALRDFYRDRGHSAKRTWADAELADLNRVRPYRYILAGEIPSDRLAPRESVSEADALYDTGLALMKEGGHNVPFLYREKKMRAALDAFRGLIEQYPTSDKIDDAAFYCGEIHKEYFKGEEPLAVRWYERAIAWNPELPLPARFQAAVVYDLRLHDRDRALELYRGVLEHESDNASNVSYALRRINVLTSDKAPSSAAFANPGGSSDEP
jgi:tetratricopeptide (TPR) repeat protein